MFITEPHPSFTDQPAPEDAVWRYMDLARYLSMLQRSALHFARADQMSDRWEGSFGKLNQELRPQLYGDDWATMAVAIGSRRAWFRERTHLNCWHLAQAESAAMWDIYQREGRGVAVRSSWGKLTSSLRPPEVATVHC